jgi:glycosyltransferase involved in cell wall biosynthesis
MPISVCITSYNQIGYLPDAINSALSQTLKPGEILVVDDASTDGSPDLISSYSARYPDLIRPIYHAQNRGVSQARNAALAAAQGDYLSFLDGDDRFLPTKLEHEMGRMARSSNTRIVFSDYYTIRQDGRRIEQWAGKRSLPEGDIFLEIFTRQFPRRRLFRSELVAASALKEMGGYDSQLKVYEDYDLRIRLAKKYPMVYNPQPESEHRRLPFGLSRLQDETYLDAFEYICRKTMPLLEDLPPARRNIILKFQNSWRAELLRRMARASLRGGTGWLAAHKQALALYRKSLIYSRTPGIKFWIQFFLPQDLVRSYRAKRGL